MPHSARQRWPGVLLVCDKGHSTSCLKIDIWHETLSYDNLNAWFSVTRAVQVTFMNIRPGDNKFTFKTMENRQKTTTSYFESRH